MGAAAGGPGPRVETLSLDHTYGHGITVVCPARKVTSIFCNGDPAASARNVQVPVALTLDMATRRSGGKG